ncbi:MAG: GUN4 domain-containing protein [Cyanobacteria bacterium P01_A01_bin.17]
MSSEPPDYTPTNLDKVFELLDKKLFTLGVPGALSFVGINKMRDSEFTDAAWCFVGAAAVWIGIKAGKALSKQIDDLFSRIGRTIANGWSTLRSDFEGQYLQRQAQLYEELSTEGYNPDRTIIPLLEDVFVPLDLSGALGSGVFSNSRNLQERDAELSSDNLDIWKLLRRSRQDRKFRKMVIQAKGGMGKTTLLRHIALIYGLRKQGRYRAPKRIPVLLRLRDYSNKDNDLLIQANPPSLPTLITEHHIPSLSKNNPLTPPENWAETILDKGNALIMFDGFDEVPPTKRPQVSLWISAQMKEYRESVFILTSRPAGFKDYVAQKPTIPLFVNKFTPRQQEDFIQRWYLCQEQCCRSKRQRRRAKEVAEERSDNLITQLRDHREELGYMAENSLLLNMLVTFHRSNPTQELPRQRIGLYDGICKLQLDDRPRARSIQMVLPARKSHVLLQTLALAMVKAERLTIPRHNLLTFLKKHPVLQQEKVEPDDWLKQMIEVSELLVEREPEEYEFPHASFQGFFAATRLANTQDRQAAQLVLKHWSGAIWRETVLLYTAQLSLEHLSQIIQEACEQGSEAADLATACLKEYPRPEKLDDDLKELLQNLNTITHDSKYQTLELLLKADKWREADNETYRLMITTVGKEEGQWFTSKELLSFPCEELLTIDGLWVKYSNGKFGFSVQKDIYLECGGIPDGQYHEEAWDKFCHTNEWKKDGKYVNVKFDTSSPRGHLPRLRGGGSIVEVYQEREVVLFSRIQTCEV